MTVRLLHVVCNYYFNVICHKCFYILVSTITFFCTIFYFNIYLLNVTVLLLLIMNKIRSNISTNVIRGFCNLCQKGRRGQVRWSCFDANSMIIIITVIDHVAFVIASFATCFCKCAYLKNFIFIVTSSIFALVDTINKCMLNVSIVALAFIALIVLSRI